MRNDRALAPLLAGLAAIVAVAAAAPSPAGASAVEFVESVSRVIGLQERDCFGPVRKLEGVLRCGVATHGAVYQAAQAEALKLAEQGVDVLDVQVPLDPPREQLADLPGFGPAPDLPGFSRLVYLIGEHRVLIWIDAPPHGERARNAPQVRPRQIAFKIEALGGPFPHVLPAISR